ncbi:hypothetical protein [Streptomyces antimycoticus]|uniref:hypothetical protein n=1 Tax=Streptomyces antimycoticus TaxID=68175 RepID=UPI0033F1943D
MASNQMPLPHGGEEIIQQVEAYKMAGVSRAMLRGCIDRGELRIADHRGTKGSPRVYRTDVARLMAEKGWPGASEPATPSQSSGDEGCRGCIALQAEVKSLREMQKRDEDTMRRLRNAFAAATA